MKQWSIDLSQWSHGGRGGGVLDIENLARGMWEKVKYRGGNSGVFISVSGVGGGFWMVIIRPEEWGKGQVLFQMWHIGLDGVLGYLVMVLMQLKWIHSLPLDLLIGTLPLDLLMRAC